VNGDNLGTGGAPAYELAETTTELKENHAAAALFRVAGNAMADP
jgi:hypothetical protein